MNWATMYGVMAVMNFILGVLGAIGGDMAFGVAEMAFTVLLLHLAWHEHEKGQRR